MKITLPITVATGAINLALWGASWAIAQADLGPWSIVIALGIASVQVILGALVFMELAEATASMTLALLAMLALWGLLIGLMCADIATRRTVPLPLPPVTYPATLPEAR